MPTFGPRKHPLQALQHLVDVATLVSPTQGGFHKPVPVTKPTSDEGTTVGSVHSGTDTSGVGNTTAEGAGAQKLLVLSPAIREHLRRVYDTLRGTRATLHQEELARFLKGTQGEVTVAPLDWGELTFEQFLEVWSFHYGWDAVRPLREDEKDLTRPFSNYFISSSHNTYLSGNQLTSTSSAHAYRKVSGAPGSLSRWIAGCLTSFSPGPQPQLPMYRNRRLEWRCLPVRDARGVKIP